jgi:hypothetical protein
MAPREPHLDKLQPMHLLFRRSPLLWWRPWSRLCSIAFVATIFGFVLSRAEEPPCRAQGPRCADIAQPASCAPRAAHPSAPDPSACHRANPDPVPPASGAPHTIPDDCTDQDAAHAPSDECAEPARPVTHAWRWNAGVPPRPR